MASNFKQLDVPIEKVRTNSWWVNQKYGEFYRKNGYIPKFFHPYNCVEIGSVCSTITTNTGVTTGIGTVLIATKKRKEGRFK